MSKKLFVGSLPWAVNDEALKQAFTPYGNVVSATVVTDRRSGRSKGFGSVAIYARSVSPGCWISAA